MLSRACAWIRDHPQAADSLVGVLLLAASAGQIPDRPAYAAGTLGVNGLLAATVAARRLAPVAAFCSAMLIAVIQIGGDSAIPVHRSSRRP